jgi:hypothetical protein
MEESIGCSAECLDEALRRGRFSALEKFVAKYRGNRVIQRILIANNGIAAVKEIRSIRKWAYEVFGDDHSMEFIVMATPEDLEGNAEYIRMADVYVAVPGGSNNNNYANVELIAEIAEQYEVQVMTSLERFLGCVGRLGTCLGESTLTTNPKLFKVKNRIHRSECTCNACSGR